MRTDERNVVGVSEGARMSYMLMRGADVLWIANDLALRTCDGDVDMAAAVNDELNEMAWRLTDEIHDASESYEGYVVALLFASASLAMAAFGQLEADEAAWKLAHADSLDDLMRGADD